MFRYRLRTLLIVLALGPPVLAGVWWLISTGALRRLAINFEDNTAVFGEALLELAPGVGAVAAVAYVLSRLAAVVTKR